MAVGGVISNDGANLVWKRLYGAASYTAASQFAVGTGTTTPAITDTALETIIAGGFAGAATYKDFVSGYPVYDTTNKRVTNRGYVSSTECNGNSITECGEFNTDGSKIMFSHDVFNAVTKTSSIELAIIWKHDLVNT